MTTALGAGQGLGAVAMAACLASSSRFAASAGDDPETYRAKLAALTDPDWLRGQQ